MARRLPAAVLCQQPAALSPALQAASGGPLVALHSLTAVVASGPYGCWAGLAALLAPLRAARRGRRLADARRSRRQLRVEATSSAVPGTEVKSQAPQQALGARVAKRAGDLVIAITNPLGEEADERLPQVGDSVQFHGGAVGHVIALSDLCFAAALADAAEVVAEGESYVILPKSKVPKPARPMITMPEAGGQVVDLTGEPFREAGRPTTPEDTDRTTVSWFNEMIGLIRRQRIDAPLHAGVMGLDAFVPIGRGQSMLLRLPARVTPDELRQFVAHIVKAQAGNDVQSVTATATAADGRRLQELLQGTDALSRFTIVAGHSETGASLGEAVLAMNAACAVAEVHRDSGKDALLLLDLEPLHRMFSVLTEVATKEGLADIANKDQNEEIGKLSDDLGVELWKYVARKNAVTARRRTFLGCFLQRAGRMSEERGGGSLTLIALARLKDDSKLSRLELEAKLKNLKQMNLDEAMRRRVVEKVEEQLVQLGEDGGSNGVPDDFIEEAKAVTDGHVVFADASVREGACPRWCVDLKESVARGITAYSVQSRPLHILKSLNLKMYLMHREEDGEVIDLDNGGPCLDNGPLLALMQQPVGDVLSPADEAALLLLALDDAERSAGARPLAEEALALLARARVRRESEEEQGAFRAEVASWAEAQQRQTPGAKSFADIEGFVESLADALGLRPLERKRVLAAAAESEVGAASGAREAKAVSQDAGVRYASLRERLGFLRLPEVAGELLDALMEDGASDQEVAQLLAALQMRISGEA